MNNLKHTPGPWKFNELYHGVPAYISGPNDALVAIFRQVKNEDARLIAAAPEMLEALIDMKRAFDPYNLGGDMYNGHHSAIEKCATVVEKATGMKIEEAIA